jgi:glycosyltransferase involved in cell wall biosynthesis
VLSPAETPLTIAHVDAESGFSGGEVQVFLLLDGLERLGHRNVLFCTPGSRAQAEAEARGIETRAVHMPSHIALGRVPALARAFRELGADLVHTNTGRDAWLGGMAAWRAGLPSVTTRRMDRRIRRGLRTRWTYLTFANRIGSISPGVTRCLVEAGVPEERIAFIPEAVDPRRVATTRPRAEARRDMGVGEDEVLVLGMGALLPRKGFDVLLDAVGQLDATSRARVQVRIGGAGASRADLERRAEALGIDERVAFLGLREDVGDVLQTADVFAMPSRAEGLGVAALEAMGAGLPVVASEVGGLAFSIVDGETGLHVPPADASRLAEALERLIRDETLRTAMGARARARADDVFHPDKMVASYVQLYMEILAS